MGSSILRHHHLWYGLHCEDFIYFFLIIKTESVMVSGETTFAEIFFKSYREGRLAILLGHKNSQLSKLKIKEPALLD